MKKVYYGLMAVVLTGMTSCINQTDYSNDIYGNGPGINGNGSSGGLMTFEGLSNFTVEKNTASLMETEVIPTDKSNEYYNSYVENNFSPVNVTTITFNGDDDATVTGIVNGDTVNIEKGKVEVHAYSKGLTLHITGSTSNGSLKIYSEKKFRLDLQNTSITNPDGAAVNIQNGNCFLVLTGNNTLSDASSASYTHPETEDMKAVLFSEDDLRISGNGSLTVNANNKVGKAAISCDDDIFIRPNTSISVNAGASAGNGIKANNTIMIKGGVQNIETSAAGSKGISSDGYINIDGGRTTVITTGGVDTSDTTDPTGCAAIKCDSIINISGGELHLKSTGQGGKGISSDQAINISGGDIYIITEGSQYGSSGDNMGGGPGGGMGRFPSSSTSSNSVSPKGIRCDGDINISGGNIFVRTSGSNGEGIESKATLTFSGGNTAALAYDDGFNAKTINITGGKAIAVSSGNCDGMDSNGAINATGGVLIGVASTLNSEDGIDCESGLTANGATVIGLSSGGMGIRISGKYIYTAITGDMGSYVSLCKDSAPLATFKLPRTYNGGRLLLCSPSLSSGNYTILSAPTPADGTLWMNYLEGCTSVSGGSSTNVTCK